VTFRRACRAVAYEFRRAELSLEQVLEDGEVPPRELFEDPAFIGLGAWNAERSVRATLLEDDDWKTVADGAEGLQLALQLFRNAFGEDDRKLDSDDVAVTEGIRRVLRSAQKGLAKAKPRTD
jgi:hypothetical protein